MFYYTGVLIWVAVTAVFLYHLPSIVTHAIDTVVFTYRLYKITKIQSTLDYLHLTLFGILLFIQLEDNPTMMTNMETGQRVYWPGKEPVLYEDGSTDDYNAFR